MHNETIECLCNEHHNMGHVLTLISMQITCLTGTHDLRGFELLNNAIGYMHKYPGIKHHPAEEVIFTKLMTSGSSLTAACGQLTNQHKSFRDQEISMLRHIRAAQAGNTEACGHLMEVGKSYCRGHAEHFSIEEKEIFPQARDILQPADWQEVMAQYKAVEDPVFREGALKYYESLYDYLMNSEVDFRVQ